MLQNSKILFYKDDTIAIKFSSHKPIKKNTIRKIKIDNLSAIITEAMRKDGFGIKSVCGNNGMIDVVFYKEL